nr:Chain B, VAL-ASP-GLU-CYS-TRP-ARG-ILE-ILE-ALA-SER-HIS-THR-TRP-PHE-CYS-ALA-GLU-GLU [synthetic construct]
VDECWRIIASHTWFCAEE